MNAAQWIIRTLRARGVERIFVLCGNGLDPLLDACFEESMPVIDVRNEQAAAYMADTWGRMTGRLGVVAVSSGPGHTNALTGLANAWWDGGPMLLISGCSPIATRGQDHFQELDQVSMAAPVSKYAGLVQHISALEQQVNTALAVTVSGRPGPAHLTVPVDILKTEMPSPNPVKVDRRPLQVSPQGQGQAALVRRAIELLAAARRPCLVVGSGAYYARAWEPLAEFAQLVGLPVFSHIWDRGCIEHAIPQYMGVTNEELNAAVPMISQTDCILTLGARIDYRLWHGRGPGFPTGATVVRIDVEPAELVRTVVPDVAILGDPATVLRQLLAEAHGVTGWQTEAWLGEVRDAHDRLLQQWDPLCREDTWPLAALRICREIKPFLDRDVTFLLDGGNIGRWAHMVLFDRHPSHWFTCGISGVVGWGLSGAVAAKLARPDHPVLLLSGDGAAGFNVTEIETAVRFRTPYVAVVAHDGAWGIVADGQPEGRHVACEFGEIRFDRVAESLGGKGIYITDPGQLGPAIAWGLQANTVVVIHVPTQLAGIGQWIKRFGHH